MVLAWYLLDAKENQEDYVHIDELETKTGILYRKFNIENLDTDGALEALRRERDYKFQDVIDISPENLQEEYGAKVRGFHEEHLHPEEEIRMILQGTTYFDVRDKDDRWIRIQMSPGDLVVLPPKIFHRLTLIKEDPNIIIYRLFKERPQWSSMNRYPE